MTGIQPNAPKAPLPIQTTTTQQTQPKAEEKKSKSTAVKVAVGTGLAALAALGIYAVTRGKGGSKEVKDVADNMSKIKNELTQKIGDIRQKESEMFDSDLLQGHFDEISKLPKEEQVKAFENMYATMSDQRFLDLEAINPETRKTFPKEVQDAIASKDQLKAGQEYIKYCDNLFEPATFKDKPVEEAIASVLGKDSKVKPHTYDLSKEADRIATTQNMGGYKNVTITSDNRIVPEQNSKNLVSINEGQEIYTIRKGAKITQKTINGKPTVTIEYGSLKKDVTGESASVNRIRLLSPNSELTPAQQDLLKLQEYAKDLDIHDLQCATASSLSMNGKMADPTDFNVILSVIQDMASKVK